MTSDAPDSQILFDADSTSAVQPAYSYSCAAAQVAEFGTRKRFDALADEWERAIRNVSSVKDRRAHPNFAELAAFGELAVGWAVARLDRTAAWGMVLAEIVGGYP